MTKEEKLANYEMMKNECFETRKLNDSLGKLVVVKNKKIKELEQENKVLTQNLEDTEIVNKALEKENAELKAKNKWYSEQVCNKECAEVWGQLTKAKDLLKRCYENYIYLEPLRSEIEQFLNSEEK